VFGVYNMIMCVELIGQFMRVIHVVHVCISYLSINLKKYTISVKFPNNKRDSKTNR